MKLHRDILYYRLSLEYDVTYANKTDPAATHGRPIFYRPTAALDDSAVIIRAEDIMKRNDQDRSDKQTLFIVIGKIDMIELTNTFHNLIVINTDESIEAVFNSIQAIYDLFDDWDGKLREALLSSISFQDMLDCTEPLNPHPMTILNNEFQYLAYSRSSVSLGLVDKFVTSDNRIPLDTLNDILVIPEYAKTLTDKDPFILHVASGSTLTKNLFMHDEYVGRIILMCDATNEAEVSYFNALLNYLSHYAERLFDYMITNDLLGMSTEGLNQLFYHAIAKKTINHDQWRKARIKAGWEEGDTLIFAQFKPSPRNIKNIYPKYLATEIEHMWKGTVCFEFYDRLLLVVNLNRYESKRGSDFKQSLAYFLRDNLLVAGLSRTFQEIDYLNSAYEQTEIALEYGAKEDPTLWTYRFDDYVLHYMLRRSVEPFEKEYICSEKLIKLMEHDEEKGSDYFNTLRTYLKNHYHATNTAKDLYIQRSSFLYRLAKINELVGIDFEDEEELLYLSMSFYILQME